MEQNQVDPQAEKTLNLYQKISEVMRRVKYLKKDGFISFKSTRYSYLSEEKMTQEIRRHLLDLGLIILPVNMDFQINNQVTTVNMKYKIIDVQTGEYEVINVGGQGSDSQDKGIAKAMTMAYKYMQRQAFAIPTGDDPDHICSDELDEMGVNQPQTPNPERVRLENEINAMLMDLSMRGVDINLLHHECMKAVKPFQFFNELTDEELRRVYEIVKAA
ncbi:ERF family protein [Alicyclobacillus shizuokensis]|uniref:ERF family protein n=1 Tax=Alicyclobacillus shizuokensis TaxID=392014 RepID=UPI00082EFAD9|nr:ERF family protein [Alicyclobacillus shizuokensis]